MNYFSNQKAVEEGPGSGTVKKTMTNIDELPKKLYYLDSGTSVAQCAHSSVRHFYKNRIFGYGEIGHGCEDPACKFSLSATLYNLLIVHFLE